MCLDWEFGVLDEIYFYLLLGDGIGILSYAVDFLLVFPINFLLVEKVFFLDL